LSSDFNITSYQDESFCNLVWKVLPNYDFDFHTAPVRYYIILLDGKIENRNFAWRKQQLDESGVIWVEDNTGKGHRTRNLLPAVRILIFITLKNAAG
jgi:hypothetical protein